MARFAGDLPRHATQAFQCNHRPGPAKGADTDNDSLRCRVGEQKGADGGVHRRGGASVAKGCAQVHQKGKHRCGQEGCTGMCHIGVSVCAGECASAPQGDG